MRRLALTMVMASLVALASPLRAEASGEAHGQPATAEHATGGHGAAHDDTKVDIPHHLSDGNEMEIPLVSIFTGPVHLPAGLTKVRVWMVLSSVVLLLVFGLARSGMGLVPKGLYNALEAVVAFVRNEIAIKNMGEHHGKEFTPFLLTLFFFILACNLLGLLPGGVTVTGNINVTAALAIITLVMVQISGMRQYGVVKHFQNLLPHGIPWWLVPIMVIVELMGVLAKPFALCVRLFANMTAGHVIIMSLIGLIFTFGTILISPVSVSFALFIYLLELMVAFLQAYIFTMLTALFIGMSVHVSH